MQLIQVDRLFDFKTLVLPKALLEIQIHTAEIDRRVNELAENFTEITEVYDAVKEGDIVLFERDDFTEENDRFVQINIGKGFYDTVWEHQVIGIHPGDTVLLSSLRGGGTAKLLQIKRLRVPELTDTLVRELLLPNVQTIEDYKSLVEQNLKEAGCEQKYRGLISYVYKQMIEKSSYNRSEVSFNPEVIRRSIAAEWAKQNHRSFNRETYEIALERYRSQGVPEDVIKEQLNYEEYLQIAPLEALEEEIFDYFRNQFTYQFV